jgi:hypothetical protein
MGAQDRRRWTVQIVRCGGCGKPRGLVHTCIRPFGRRPQRTRLKPQVRVRCGTCGQRRSPLAAGHLCRTGFKQRRRRVEAVRSRSRRRARAAAVARRRRARETEARRTRRQRESEARKRRREREDEGRRERRQRERDQERQRRRNAAETRKATPRGQRTRKPSTSGPRRAPRPDLHPYDMCADDDCQRKACVAYRHGVEDCPLPHGGN